VDGKQKIEIIPMTGEGNCIIPLNKWFFHNGNIEELEERIFHYSYKAGGWRGNQFTAVGLFDGKYNWEEVKIPHDWLADMSLDPNGDSENGYKPRGMAWYYMAFDLPEREIEDAFLTFEGVMGHSEIYLNGNLVGRNFSGYNKFTIDVGDYLCQGENILALFIDGRKWELYSYEGAGIYRPCYIELKNRKRINHDKCFIRSEFTDKSWRLSADISVEGISDFALRTVLKDADGKIVLETTTDDSSFELPVSNPQLWSPETPYIYTATCYLMEDGKAIDSVSANVGFRHIEWTADNGMYLNGKAYLIKGICCHQDHAGVGAAITDEILEYRLGILKEMGANAYRCAHNAPDERLLRMCDKFGFLVMVENRHFSVAEDVLNQLDSLVYISRNHPSVFMYSLFNEELLHREIRGVRMAQKMKNRIYRLDSTRVVTAALNGGTLKEVNTSSVQDVIGMNYFINEYEETHKRFPDKAIIGSENCPTPTTRGEYVTDTERQVYSNYADNDVDFSEDIRETMEAMEKYSFVAGCFVWNGFDYRGEPVPYKWPSVTCHWGFTDYCGFWKDTAYLIKAWYREELMAHLLPHWNWNNEDSIRVCAYTNGDEAELFLNGNSLGKKTVEARRAEWQVEYVPGSLEVVVTRGDEVIRDAVKTAGIPANIVIEDVTPCSSNRRILNVKVTDKDGVLVPDFSETVSFEATDGKIVGVGNGNPNSHHNDNDNKIALFHGLGQVIVEGKAVRATCDGLPEKSIMF